ncbi:hypothetical protein ACFZ8E_14420 [Methylobacterium sp. HMF5984]|uniref:hypothetical protein n=1 Tax=Methylobacterium sp. HMF5984 TaxID=3367370 RepID=UPI0038542E3D
MKTVTLKENTSQGAVYQIDKNGLFLCSVIIFIGVLLQKIALPGTNNSLPLSTIGLPVLLFFSWAIGILKISPYSFVLYSVFVACSGISFIVNAGAESVSLLSLALVCVVQSCFIFQPTPRNGFPIGTLLYQDAMVFLSVLGIAQFASQKFIGPELAFFLDYKLPPSLVLSTYHNLNPLYYGSDLFKSNGVFFAEPAFFSQFIGLAAIIELATQQRITRLLIYACAILCSYSGTGIIILAVFGSYLAIRNGKIVLIIGIITGTICLVLFGSILEIHAITNRLEEFSTPNSSGHARFISAFSLIDKITFDNIESAIFGKGPGTYSSYDYQMPFLVFDPTWAKLLFEYGLIGFVTYASYLSTAMKSSNKTLIAPLIITYAFFGGYITNTSIISVMILLGIYSDRNLSIN